jgi:hypothetical protein
MDMSVDGDDDDDDVDEQDDSLTMMTTMRCQTQHNTSLYSLCV